MENRIHKKVAIDLNIKAACFNTSAPLDILIEWRRGTKKIETKPGKASPENPIVTFNEKFQMKTMLDFDPQTEQFIRKESQLVLMSKMDKTNLGQTNFDFSDYVGKKSASYKLPLKGGPDDEAYIEIYIRTKVLDRDNSPT